MTTPFAIGDTVHIETDLAVSEPRKVATVGKTIIVLDDGTRWLARNGRPWGGGDARLLCPDQAAEERTRRRAPRDGGRPRGLPGQAPWIVVSLLSWVLLSAVVLGTTAMLRAMRGRV